MSADILTCDRCRSEISPSLLNCPVCGRLRYSERLQVLEAEATAALTISDASRALTCWNEMLTLLPESSPQYRAVRARIVEASGPGRLPAPVSSGSGRAVRWGALGVLLATLAGKGKLLLLGLTKMSTLLSMLASIGVYWTLYGWRLAVGLVISIYIHEMGHVAMLRRYGIKADAPLFIPGLGAFVRSKQAFDNPQQNADVGLAGPFSGLAVAIAAYATAAAMHWPSWAAVGHLGAWINLFNLVPLAPLDGSRGFDGLSTRDRRIFLGVVLALWAMSKEGLLLLILAVGIYRLFKEFTPLDSVSSGHVLWRYLFLLLALTGLSMLDPQHFPFNFSTKAS